MPANTTSNSDSSLCHQLYEYYVRANDRNSSYTSESYIVGNVPRYDYNPRISSITYASVADENEIEVVWPKNSFSEFDYNKVFKYQNNWEEFVDSFDAKDNSLIDYDVNTNQYSYIYTYNEVDRCGYRTEIGREGKTILLKGVYDNGSQLNWSPYEKWENGVNRYRIEFDHNTDLRLIQKSDGKTLSYKDNSIYPEVKGKYCYRVHATNDKSDSSYSNWVCLYGPPVAFIPSGFTPNGDGLNDGFNLVTRFVKRGDLKEIKDFRLSVLTGGVK